MPDVKARKKPAGRKSAVNVMTLQRELLDILKPDNPQTSLEITEALDARGFTVDKNTVRRNLLKLESAGVVSVETPTNDRMNSAHRYRLVGKGHMNPVALRLVDALSLKLVESTLSHLLPATLLREMRPTFAQATRKLVFLEKLNPNARWPNLVAAIPRTFELAPPRIDPKILEAVQEALLSGTKLDVVYRSLQATADKPRRLSPHALLHKGQVTYLIATEESKPDPRTYALHRMKSATPSAERASRLGFNLHDYLAEERHEPGGNEAITLEARISTNLAKILRETPINKTMAIGRDGDGFRIKAEVRDNLALHRWILGHGDAIEVLAPESLRDAIAKTVRAAAERYA